MRIPVWIRRFNIQFPRLIVDMGVVDVTGKDNSGTGVIVVVFGWELDLEFEYAIGVEASS